MARTYRFRFGSLSIKGLTEALGDRSFYCHGWGEAEKVLVIDGPVGPLLQLSCRQRGSRTVVAWTAKRDGGGLQKFSSDLSGCPLPVRDVLDLLKGVLSAGSRGLNYQVRRTVHGGQIDGRECEIAAVEIFDQYGASAGPAGVYLEATIGSNPRDGLDDIALIDGQVRDLLEEVFRQALQVEIRDEEQIAVQALCKPL